MKAAIYLLWTSLILFLFSPTQLCAQEEDDKACQLILQDGLYKQYAIINSGNFNQDLKTYFTSDNFRREYRQGKWGGKLGVVIEGVPVELGANASDQQITEFQNRVGQSTSLTVNQSFYDYSSTVIPDVELAKVYTECIKDRRRYGFKITPRVGERDAFFVINYTKHPSEMAGMPIVRRFELRGATNISKSFDEGDELTPETSISSDRIPDRDLVLLLETDRGVASHRVPAEPSGFNKDFPVGTIVCSYLNWSEFQTATQNNFSNPAGNIWSSRYSRWAPADGRQIPNSAFQRITSQTNIPDLRGMFLRGLNQFDPEQPNQASNDWKDPENRTRGTKQSDAFKVHQHNVRDEGHHHGLKGAIVRDYASPGGGEASSVPNTNDFWMGRANIREDDVGNPDETRPKNIAIFYYIRIN